MLEQVEAEHKKQLYGCVFLTSSVYEFSYNCDIPSVQWTRHNWQLTSNYKETYHEVISDIVCLCNATVGLHLVAFYADSRISIPLSIM